MEIKTEGRLFLIAMGRNCGKNVIAQLVNDHVADHGSISADDITEIIKKVSSKSQGDSNGY